MCAAQRLVVGAARARDLGVVRVDLGRGRAVGDRARLVRRVAAGLARRHEGGAGRQDVSPTIPSAAVAPSTLRSALNLHVLSEYESSWLVTVDASVIIFDSFFGSFFANLGFHVGTCASSPASSGSSKQRRATSRAIVLSSHIAYASCGFSVMSVNSPPNIAK
jgi:hypothetical protein